jgi:glycosyltransferase involved in cell wall biosynthesis
VDGSVPKTERKKRILVVAPRDPYPVIGGDRLRIHRIARTLARHYDLTLLTLCTSKRERDAAAPADGVFQRVHRVVLPQWRSWLNVLGAIPSTEPLQVAYYRSAAFRDAVEALAPEHDAVLAHLVRTAPYVSGLPGLRMLEMTDAISMSMQRVARTDAGYFDPRRIIYAIEALRLRAYERRIASAFDLVTFTSVVDKSFLFGSEGTALPPIMIFANGADVPAALPPPHAVRNADEIAFVGHLGSLQNFDAAWFFAHDVLPLIRAHRPNARFRLIGPIRRGAARKLGKLPGVRVEGLVPSIADSLATARVGVCPNRMSAGVQNKVLDYFANRVAVVCSSTGLEGIDATVGEHLLTADTAEQWASQVLLLLENEALAQRLADAGRDLVAREYRWQQRVQPLVSRLDNLFDQRARAVPGTAALPDAAPALAEGERAVV